MNFIAVETSTNICSVALFQANKMIDLIENEEENSHSKELGVFVKNIFDQNNILINDINYIALSSGPGSFTGLRIGSSLAKGMAFALKIPIVMVPTLQSLELAIKIKEDHNVCVFSHSDQFYLQNFKNGIPISDIKLVSANDLKSNEKKLFGYRLEKSSISLKYTEIKPSSKLIGKLSNLKYDDWVVKDINEAELNYINNFNIKKS
ncbi:MAG: tRNA (adenosine(37)-N6)-threonylcarbamoyltransferase complex dimerization subunit type 1 TsaB [Candidatus Marinimicrobia bacterium]|nr:tRNA (adenosine(37)-N6)-threonylcarbamoyltransferase complex dimerization subunit type 1 TsaB [Candidatus Neomarinimicrobiota bacterium]|tara:strand:- start:170 stop:787 length:618 start_codon:yes stop_codon:yes gene_type:complete